LASFLASVYVTLPGFNNWLLIGYMHRLDYCQLHNEGIPAAVLLICKRWR